MVIPMWRHSGVRSNTMKSRSMVVPSMSVSTPVTSMSESTIPMPSLSSSKRQVSLKFLVVGGSGVGKTSIIKRYVHNSAPSCETTINDKIATKFLNWDNDTVVEIQLRDIFCDQSSHAPACSYQGVAAAIVVFDIGKLWSFKTAERFVRDIRLKTNRANGCRIPIILLANKADLNWSFVAMEDISQFCKRNDVDAWCPTSAKLNTNIKTAIQYLVKRCLNEKPRHHHESLVQIFKRTAKKIQQDYLEKLRREKTDD